MEGPSLLAALLPLPLTLPIAMIDLRRQIIPDALNLALLLLGLGLAGLQEPDGPARAVSIALAQAALAFALLFLFRSAYARLRGRQGLGLGDVKFVAAATAFVGLSGLPAMILVASLSGLIAMGLAHLAGRRVAATTRLPFGPFLVLGLHAALACGGLLPEGA